MSLITIEHDGQTYRQTGQCRDYTKPNGHTVILFQWASTCPTCSAPFTQFSVGPDFPAKHLRRRCDTCKQPGRRVAHERRHRQTPPENASPGCP